MIFIEHLRLELSAEHRRGSPLASFAPVAAAILAERIACTSSHSLARSGRSVAGAGTRRERAAAEEGCWGLLFSAYGACVETGFVPPFSGRQVFTALRERMMADWFWTRL